jgi:hypothetical protein
MLGWVDSSGELKNLRPLPADASQSHTERSFEGHSFAVVQGEARAWVGGYRITRITPLEAFQPRTLVIGRGAGGAGGALELTCLHGSDEDEVLGAMAALEEEGGGDPLVLKKYLGAIARAPSVAKYRTLKLRNPHFHRAAWASAGARALLAALGFSLAEAPAADEAPPEASSSPAASLAAEASLGSSSSSTSSLRGGVSGEGGGPRLVPGEALVVLPGPVSHRTVYLLETAAKHLQELGDARLTLARLTSPDADLFSPPPGGGAVPAATLGGEPPPWAALRRGSGGGGSGGEGEGGESQGSGGADAVGWSSGGHWTTHEEQWDRAASNRGRPPPPPPSQTRRGPWG